VAHAASMVENARVVRSADVGPASIDEQRFRRALGRRMRRARSANVHAQVHTSSLDQSRPGSGSSTGIKWPPVQVCTHRCAQCTASDFIAAPVEQRQRMVMELLHKAAAEGPQRARWRVEFRNQEAVAVCRRAVASHAEGIGTV
jgi:hypothetical protein